MTVLDVLFFVSHGKSQPGLKIHTCNCGMPVLLPLFVIQFCFHAFCINYWQEYKECKIKNQEYSSIVSRLFHVTNGCPFTKGSSKGNPSELGALYNSSSSQCSFLGQDHFQSTSMHDYKRMWHRLGQIFVANPSLEKDYHIVLTSFLENGCHQPLRINSVLSNEVTNLYNYNNYDFPVRFQVKTDTIYFDYHLRKQNENIIFSLYFKYLFAFI